MEQPVHLELIGEHPGSVRIGRFKNLIIGAWFGPPNDGAVRTLLSIMKTLHRGSAEVRSYVHLLPDQVPLPDAKAREGLSYLMNHYEQHIACVGVVIAGTGFWASAMRSAVGGLRILVRTPFDFRMESSAEDVSSWLPDSHAKRTGVRITAHELRELFAEARSWQTMNHTPSEHMSATRAR